MPPMLIPHQAPLLLPQTPFPFVSQALPCLCPQPCVQQPPDMWISLHALSTGPVDRQKKVERETSPHQDRCLKLPRELRQFLGGGWYGSQWPGIPKSWGSSPSPLASHPFSLAALTDNPLPLALWANPNVLSTVSPYPAPWGEGESATSSLWSLQRGKGQCGHPNFQHCSIRGGLTHHSPFREPSRCIPPRAEQGLPPQCPGQRGAHVVCLLSFFFLLPHWQK